MIIIMPDFLLRKCDAVLWRRVKVRAVSDGVTLRSVIIGLLSMYAKGKLKIK